MGILDQASQELHPIKFSFRTFRLKTVQTDAYNFQCFAKLVEGSDV
jgi:hypothetical protein